MLHCTIGLLLCRRVAMQQPRVADQSTLLVYYLTTIASLLDAALHHATVPRM